MKITKGLNYIRQFLDKPVATYTHTVNKEVVVSAVDVATDTITSVGHGLVNGNIVTPVVNDDAGNVYLDALLIGGLPVPAEGVSYYVVNKTDDTFQLSIASGGAAIDLTANASLDLTKWHFEVFISSVSITGLPPDRKYRLKIQGKTCYKSAIKYILPNGITAVQEWFKSGGTALAYPTLGISGNLFFDAEVIVDYQKILTVTAKSTALNSTDAVKNTTTINAITLMSPKYMSAEITSISLTNSYFANGTVVEVYKV